MKLRVTISNASGVVINDFWVVATPSEEAATDADRNKLGNIIQSRMEDEFDVDDIIAAAQS